eukprot:m.487303 g.487303  ORF g.487303 m.487303 type:complete len:598 (-) comp24932_c0_seq1:62-1855(-)
MLESLPAEVAVQVLAFLSVGDVARCACVCRAWRSIVADDGLWHDLCVRQPGFRCLLDNAVPVPTSVRSSQAGVGGAAGGDGGDGDGGDGDGDGGDDGGSSVVPATVSSLGGGRKRQSRSEEGGSGDDSETSCQDSAGSSFDTMTSTASSLPSASESKNNGDHGKRRRVQSPASKASTQQDTSFDFGALARPQQRGALSWRALLQRWRARQDIILQGGGWKVAVSARTPVPLRCKLVLCNDAVSRGRLVAGFLDGSVSVYAWSAPPCRRRQSSAEPTPTHVSAAAVADLGNTAHQPTLHKLHHTPNAHKGAVVSLACDGATWEHVTGSMDMTIAVWDTAAGEQRHSLTGHEDGVVSLTVNRDYLCSGSLDRTVRIWSRRSSYTCLRTFEHEAMVVSSALSQNCVFAGGNDHVLHVHNIITGNSRALKGHTDCIHCTALAHNGRYILSGSDDKTICVWQPSGGVNDKPCKVLKGHWGAVLMLRTRGDLVASGSADQCVRLWSLSQGTCTHTLDEHYGLIMALEFVCGRFLVSASVAPLDHADVIVWDMQTGTLVEKVAGAPGTASCLSADDGVIVCGTQRGIIACWAVQEEARPSMCAG